MWIWGEGNRRDWNWLFHYFDTAENNYVENVENLLDRWTFLKDDNTRKQVLKSHQYNSFAKMNRACSDWLKIWVNGGADRLRMLLCLTDNYKLTCIQFNSNITNENVWIKLHNKGIQDSDLLVRFEMTINLTLKLRSICTFATLSYSSNHDLIAT